MRASEIAKDFDLKLINITENNLSKYSKKYDIKKSDLKNNAYIIEDTDILLGIYDDKELRMAAFFHEVGHTLVKENFEKMVNYDLMLIEYQAWVEGLKIAKKYKYEFSNKVFKYILKTINSYYKDALSVYNKKCKKGAEKEKANDQN